MADSKRSVSKSSRGGVTLARGLLLLLLIASWAFVLASLIGFDAADPPGHVVWPPNSPVHNWCGPFGATVAYTLFKLLGVGAWSLVLLLGLGLMSAAASSETKHPFVRIVGVVMFSIALAGLHHLILPSLSAIPGLAGGLIGQVGGGSLAERFGMVGSTLILMVAALIGLIVAMDEWMLAFLSWTWSFTRERGLPAARVAGAAAGSAALSAGGVAARASGGVLSDLWGRVFSRRPRPVRLDDLEGDVLSSGPRRRSRKAPADPDAADTTDAAVTASAVGVADPDEELTGPGELDQPSPAKPRSRAKAAQAAEPSEDSSPNSPAAESPADEIGDEGDQPDDATPGPAQVYSEDQLREKIAKLPVFFGQKDKQVATQADIAALQTKDEPTPEQPEKVYQFPSLDLLENPEENFNVKLEEYVREQATALEMALKQYRIDGEVVGIESGPVITLFDVRLAPGTKVSALQAVSSDIARALKAINIRIVPNQVGRDTVGVEVPNTTKEKVRMKELMGRTEAFSSMKLPMFLGKDASGEVLIEDLTKMPHMLIAGTTGSGKSVCMNTIIMGFLYTKKPSELKMVLVDPKMVEMSQFKDIPHLMCPVVTEMSKAAAILEWATTKMDERYELLAEAGCRDIAAYNDLPFEELAERLNAKTPEEQARVPRKLPYMVFIIDELADLMMTNKEVEGHIIRIAQKARAVGIHLILATQRPQANVVTGLIKSNMPCRIAFKVASGMDSRIVLDQKGGELLLGHGDMLFLSPRSSKLSRAQGTLVDDHEIRRVVRFMKDVAGPSFERQLLQLRAGAADASGLGNLTDEERALKSQNNSSASLAAAQEDPLFPRAVEIVLETRRGSVSLLQRRLAIGYTRASRLIDLMGISGIISDHKGSVARDVLITEDEWAKMKQLAAGEANAKGIKTVFNGGSGSAATGDLFDSNQTTEAAPFQPGSMPTSLSTEDDRFDDAFEEDPEQPSRV
ncbi:MAG: DNA translocase FtsK [Phycisphaerales bacterium]|nr:DNA translocase FtsK [Phycisphaerales bacterium]